MASSLSPKLSHLSLVLLVVNIFAVSAQVHQAVVIYYNTSGYIHNPLYPRPSGSSTISETLYTTKTRNRYSGVVARWDLLPTPQAGDWEISIMALVLGVITPKTSMLDGSDGHDNVRLQPFAVEGLFNGSDLYGKLVVRSLGSQVTGQVTHGIGEIVSGVISLASETGEAIGQGGNMLDSCYSPR